MDDLKFYKFPLDDRLVAAGGGHAEAGGQAVYAAPEYKALSAAARSDMAACTRPETAKPGVPGHGFVYGTGCCVYNGVPIPPHRYPGCLFALGGGALTNICMRFGRSGRLL